LPPGNRAARSAGNRDGHYGFGVLYIMVACAILWAFIALPVGVGAVLAKRRMKAR
jgi:hypothetical protein